MRIRKLSVERLHKAFGDATLEWPNASPITGLSHYMAYGETLTVQRLS